MNLAKAIETIERHVATEANPFALIGMLVAVVLELAKRELVREKERAS